MLGDSSYSQYQSSVVIEGSAFICIVRLGRQLMWLQNGSVLGTLLFILCTSEPFHTIGNHIVGYANNTTICAVIPKPRSRLQVME